MRLAPILLPAAVVFAIVLLARTARDGRPRSPAVRGTGPVAVGARRAPAATEPVRPPAPGRGHVFLDVDAVDGRPVDNLHVEPTRRDAPSFRPAGENRWAALDAAPGVLDVTVGAAGCAPQALRIPVVAGSTIVRQVRLRDQEGPYGVVVDTKGRRLPRIDVTAQWRGATATVATDDAGIFTLPRAGRPTVIFTRDEDRLHAPGSLHPTGPGPYTIRLSPAPRIVGRVVPSPAGSVTIRAAWDVPLADGTETAEHVVVPQGDGRFATRLAPPHLGVWLTIRVEGRAPWVSRRLVLRTDRDNDLGDVETEAGAERTLTVVDEKGRPIAGAVVAPVFPGDPEPVGVAADAGGRARLAGLPSRETTPLRVSAAGFVTETVRQTHGTGVQLRRAGTVAGRAIDAHERPLAGAIVTTELGVEPPYRAKRTVAWTARTDEDGWFRGYLPPGRHDLGVEIPGSIRPAGAQRVWVESGQETRIVLSVATGPPPATAR